MTSIRLEDATIYKDDEWSALEWIPTQYQEYFKINYEEDLQQNKKFVDETRFGENGKYKRRKINFVNY
mgnify:FL=1